MLKKQNMKTNFYAKLNTHTEIALSNGFVNNNKNSIW